MTNGITAEVIGQLRAAAAAFKKSPIYGQIVEPRDQVLAQFRPIFSLDHVNAISADEFKSFLLLENTVIGLGFTAMVRESARIWRNCAMGYLHLLQKISLLLSGSILQLAMSTVWARMSHRLFF